MIVERIVAYLQAKGIAVSALERDLGLGNTTLSRAYRSGGSIGTDKLEKIISYCKDLNPAWLLTGEGDMIIGAEAHENKEKQPAQAVYVTNVDDFERIVADAIKKALSNG